MGPHSFKCGSFHPALQPFRHQKGFNGAALFQVRKYHEYGNPSHPKRWASMGPHSFKCGSARLARYPPLRSPQLQWGRTLSSAEVSGGLGARVRLTIASMGPHSFKCGSSGETANLRQHRLASMGPHSFKCGSLPNSLEESVRQ